MPQQVWAVDAIPQQVWVEGGAPPLPAAEEGERVQLLLLLHAPPQAAGGREGAVHKLPTCHPPLHFGWAACW